MFERLITDLNSFPMSHKLVGIAVIALLIAITYYDGGNDDFKIS